MVCVRWKFHTVILKLTPVFNPNASGVCSPAGFPLASALCLSDSSRISTTFSCTFWEKKLTIGPSDSMNLRAKTLMRPFCEDNTSAVRISFHRFEYFLKLFVFPCIVIFNFGPWFYVKLVNQEHIPRKHAPVRPQWVAVGKLWGCVGKTTQHLSNAPPNECARTGLAHRNMWWVKANMFCLIDF